jgi:hypothetical protein
MPHVDFLLAEDEFVGEDDRQSIDEDPHQIYHYNARLHQPTKHSKTHIALNYNKK